MSEENPVQQVGVAASASSVFDLQRAAAVRAAWLRSVELSAASSPWVALTGNGDRIFKALAVGVAIGLVAKAIQALRR